MKPSFWEERYHEQNPRKQSPLPASVQIALSISLPAQGCAWLRKEDRRGVQNPREAGPTQLGASYLGTSLYCLDDLTTMFTIKTLYWWNEGCYHLHMWRNWGVWSFCNKWQKPKCMFALGRRKQVTEVVSWIQGVRGRGERQHKLIGTCLSKLAYTTIVKLVNWEDWK